MRTRHAGIAVVIIVSVLTSGIVGATSVVDLDGDGEPALIEISDGSNPLKADTDSDGLDDGEEKEYGTDPTDADTDNDNLDDGPEVHEYGSDPVEFDTDGDGLSDPVEVREYGSDPAVRDSDSDGLEDGPEVNEYGTDPAESDTDRDGLDDGVEVHEYGSDPTNSDTDDDSLEDGIEVDKYGTDPAESDTDSDGLDDDRELDFGTDPTESDTDGDGLSDGAELDEYETDPTDPDSDNDELEDGPEVNEYATDPNNPDTDGDGLKDGWEVHRVELFPDADPLRTDIYVEVDTMEGVSFDRDEAERVAEKFEAAPISNPDGSAGANLHFVYDGQQIPHKSSADADTLRHYRRTHFDRIGKAYHYIAVVDEVGDSGSGSDTMGMGTIGYTMVESQSSDGETARIIMHELGHSLGLKSDDFSGVDSWQYSFSEYPSVMNYNSPANYLGYSEGKAGPNDFDDWRYIETEMYTPGAVYVD